MSEFEAVYLAHFEKVYRYVLSLCQNSALAEEITQETFCKAMEHMDQFDGKGRISTWLCQIAKNTYLSHYRKHKRLVPEASGEDWAGTASDMEEAYLDRETARTLHRLLHQLREPYKEVFMLRTFGELPFGQIGEIFGKTDSWARLVFYRAKNELRRRLDEGDLSGN
ncbi:MAG: RNA polymerase sigma factor [Evtepia sp.]|uniref:RNA polymerase sigma factor n=1 Tax=Evtepia sp. TaxID=2773933 RepID=UPI002A7667EA|nr:RNA polymerase sigma factor [Evtepia sp.]MDY3014819.1 RNA polymerase sigma factor [Evtepia sp.]